MTERIINNHENPNSVAGRLGLKDVPYPVPEDQFATKDRIVAKYPDAEIQGTPGQTGVLIKHNGNITAIFPSPKWIGQSINAETFHPCSVVTGGHPGMGHEELINFFPPNGDTINTAQRVLSLAKIPGSGKEHLTVLGYGLVGAELESWLVDKNTGNLGSTPDDDDCEAQRGLLERALPKQPTALTLSDQIARNFLDIAQNHPDRYLNATGMPPSADVTKAEHNQHPKNGYYVGLALAQYGREFSGDPYANNVMDQLVSRSGYSSVKEFHQAADHDPACWTNAAFHNRLGLSIVRDGKMGILGTDGEIAVQVGDLFESDILQILSFSLSSSSMAGGRIPTIDGQPLADPGLDARFLFKSVQVGIPPRQNFSTWKLNIEYGIFNGLAGTSARCGLIQNGLSVAHGGHRERSDASPEKAKTVPTAGIESTNARMSWDNRRLTAIGRALPLLGLVAHEAVVAGLPVYDYMQRKWPGYDVISEPNPNRTRSMITEFNKNRFSAQNGSVLNKTLETIQIIKQIGREYPAYQDDADIVAGNLLASTMSPTGNYLNDGRGLPSDALNYSSEPIDVSRQVHFYTMQQSITIKNMPEDVKLKYLRCEPVDLSEYL